MTSSQHAASLAARRAPNRIKVKNYCIIAAYSCNVICNNQ